MDKDTTTQTFQHFKFTLPILKTRTAIVKDAEGKDVEKRYVEGVASSTDLDLHGDRMDPSAIKTMADSLKFHVIRLNAEHDTSWQSELGDISKLDVSEDSRLLIEAELNDMSKSKDLWYALTELNKKLGLSIGGYVKEYEMVKEEFKDEESGEMDTKWVRHYKNIELDHIAVTSSPANPKTWVGAIAKSIQEDSELLAKKLEEQEAEAEETIEESVDISKPYPNEHACRLRNPGDFQDNSMRSMERDHNGKKYRVIMGRLKGQTTMTEQAYRYNKETWSADEARSHCTSHKGSFEAAQKSINENIEMSDKEKHLREVARTIVRAIQNLEADLLLELTYAGLNILSESQVKLLDTLLIERSQPMDKNVSLEAEEAKKKADTAAQPEGETVETPATPENESKEETPKAEATKAEEPKGDEPKADEAEATEEGKAEETPAAPSEEKTEEKPAEELKPEEPTKEEPKVEGEQSEESSGGEKSADEKGEGEAEPTVPSEGESEKDETKPEEKTEDKSAEQQAVLLKSIQDLTDGMKKILETNETLTKRVAELEKEPASRKTVELEKGIGDEEVDSTDTKTLKQEMDEKIADIRKNNPGSPSLFAMIQKVRAEYAKKVKGQ